MSRSCALQPWPSDCSYLDVYSLCTSKSLDEYVTVLHWYHKIFHLMWYTPWSSVIHPNYEWVGIKYVFIFRPVFICIVCYCVFDFYIFQSLNIYFPFISFFFAHPFIFDFSFRFYIFIVIPELIGNNHAIYCILLYQWY